MKVPPENTKELLGNMRAVLPSFLVITLCFVNYQPNEKVSMEKVLWNTFLLSSDTAEIHRGPPQAFLCEIKDNQCPLIYVCDANRNGNNKMLFDRFVEKIR